MDHQQNPNKLKQLVPLFLVLTGIAIATLVMCSLLNLSTLKEFMRIFMGFTLVTFGIFKLIDLRGFAYAFAEYDIIAKQSIFYSYAYPFIEVALGAAYLLNTALLPTNIITATIMFIGSIGVTQSLLTKKDITCACLGAVIKLPMTWITLLESIIMGLMAVYMIFM